MKRTKLQNSIIHASKHKSGISEENYRAAIYAISSGRTESSAELDVKEANELIVKLGGTPTDFMKRKGGSKAKPTDRSVVKMVSHGQRNTITQLAMERWGDSHATALKSFCESSKTIGKAYPRTSKEAQRVIETLKAMNRRDAAKRAAA